MCDTIVKAGPAPIANSDPAAQVRRNAGRLHDFLEADDIAQYVKGAVVWANPDSPMRQSISWLPAGGFNLRPDRSPRDSRVFKAFQKSYSADSVGNSNLWAVRRQCQSGEAH